MRRQVIWTVGVALALLVAGYLVLAGEQGLWPYSRVIAEAAGALFRN
jgi:hypothetical protein